MFFQQHAWQTPTTQPERQNSYPSAPHIKRPSLGDQAAWPTPNAMDGERGASPGGLPKHKGGVNLREARNWPTPRAEDCEQTGGHAGVPDTLTAASRVWATPNQRDWKDTGPTQGNRNSPNLGTQAHAVGLPDQGNRSTSGKHRGSLSAKWVTQLQGFPDGWLVVGTEALSKPSATPKSRRSSNSSRVRS
jgi:site-specific DNA-cytosine methylase